MSEYPYILFINPWIHDFAAYDFWAKPLGLLQLAGILRMLGMRVAYVDCQDRFYPQMPPKNPYQRFGRGPYLKTKIPKPKALAHIPRTYSRYGILPEWFEETLKQIGIPDVIMITSSMTYWYPGVVETIESVKKVFPTVPVVLGGIYASLCHAHAVKKSGADWVVKGPGEAILPKVLEAHTGVKVAFKYDPLDLDTYPYPAFDLQRCVNYIPLLTSRGCPFHCKYCASNLLMPNRRVRSPQNVVTEIKYWQDQFKVIDFAIYDDAFLVDSEKHALPIFDRILTEGLDVRLHTPNALHIREITSDVAQMMARVGFQGVRLGLETADFDPQNRLDRKVKEEEFLMAIQHLYAAGFQKQQIGANLLIGLPGQSPQAIEASIRMVRKHNITPIPTYFSPIPGTPVWEEAKLASRYPLEDDPIYSNNAIMPSQKEPFDWGMITWIKSLVTQ